MQRGRRSPSRAARPSLRERCSRQPRTDERGQRSKGLLAALGAADGDDAARVRAHLFFRNVQGVWACSDPACPAVDPEYRSDDRTVGRLYSQPQYRCDCGARVLDLLYCQTCGDLFLGGFRGTASLIGDDIDAFLLPDIPNLDDLPEQASLSRNCDDLPRLLAAHRRRLPTRTWTRDNGSYTFEFRRSVYDPRPGSCATRPPVRPAGRSTSTAGTRRRRRTGAAVPDHLPACGDDWEMWKTGREAAGRGLARARGRRSGRCGPVSRR